MTAIYVAIGGMIGAVLRYFTTVYMGKITGIAGFPLGVMTVNIVGSFLMGILVGLGAHHITLSQEVRALLQIGILGGFTTFSSFSLDVITLFERGQIMAAITYATLSVILSIIAILSGMFIMRP